MNDICSLNSTRATGVLHLRTSSKKGRFVCLKAASLYMLLDKNLPPSMSPMPFLKQAKFSLDQKANVVFCFHITNMYSG
jgi:hypothetical protein